MITREEFWVWDSWYAHDKGLLHAFYLKAPKSLVNPDLRHHQAEVGHSVSTDGTNWEVLPDALNKNSEQAFDNQGIWTGSIVKHEDLWHMFYTGIDQESKGRIQRIGHATSADLISWTRVSNDPTLTAKSPWYATAETDPKAEEPFRDPWVFHYENKWHMLVTARDSAGDGTMAHATSEDLWDWELQPPLIENASFAQLEVFQVVEVDGQWVLVFCAAPQDVTREGIEKSYATYAVSAQSPLGPFNLDTATPITPNGGVYAGRIVLNEFGAPKLYGFIDNGQPGGFQGVISDPIDVQLTSEGVLVSLEYSNSHHATLVP